MHYYRHRYPDWISNARNHGRHPRQVSPAHQGGDRGDALPETDEVIAASLADAKFDIVTSGAGSSAG
jgi:hypothetical protein